MTGSPTPVAIGPGEREEAGRSVRGPDVSRRRAGRRGRGCREVRRASSERFGRFYGVLSSYLALGACAVLNLCVCGGVVVVVCVVCVCVTSSGFEIASV